MSTGEPYDDDEDHKPVNSGSTVKKSNVLPLWGNERTMNLNPLILTNIQSSHYFKVNLYELKTYHEVIDEIYYKVAHLEPWEKGSRKTAGQTGMCGGVRGVGAGGIVSTAYCLLYKLFTLKLTRKQLNGLITHPDSPYIRALGFMYIRYTQPPPDLWDWYEEYLEDDEELDVKAGGGQTMTIGELLKKFLTKLDWFSTLFPRIPVPIQQKIEKNMSAKFANVRPATTVPKPIENSRQSNPRSRSPESVRRDGDERRRERRDDFKRDDYTRDYEYHKDKHRERDRDSYKIRDSRGSRDRDRERGGSRERHREKRCSDRDRKSSGDWEKSHREHHEHRSHRHKEKHHKHSRSKSRSPTRHRHRH